ncbi:ATP-binding protein [bacterium]|nr:ATP-binding protein [bacterium]
MPGTTLIDAIVSAIRKNKLTKLKSQLSSVDVLILDDIQFLAGKEKTQEVFLDIFNELVMRNKQIILSSDQPPKDLVNIEARLKSRFAK